MNTYYTLITGASEGLGRSLALECASRGMNLVLIALPGSGLEKLSSYIQINFGVQVTCIEKDLSEDNACRDIHHTISALQLQINMLINNAGMGGTYPFQRQEADYYTKLISLNTITPTILTRMFINDLTRHAPSYILNVSSLAAMFNLPQKQVYGATKSFMLFFSRSLHRELKKDGVHVSALCPGGINTTPQLTQWNRTSGTWLSRQSIMDPYSVARIAIRQLLKKKEVIIPGWWNHVFIWMNRLIPQRIKDYMIDYQMNRTPSGTAQVNHLRKSA